MRKVQLFLILFGISAALAGCDSKPASNIESTESSRNSASATSGVPNDGPSSKATTAQTDRKDKRPVLVCFGDSLTAGAGTDPGQSYPDYLQKDLDKLNYKYRVLNLGVSGNTTKDGVERLPEVLATQPAVVVVEFGGNDGLRGLPISESRTNLDRIIRTLKEAGIQVAIAGITLPPNYGEDYIHKFDETYSILANKYHVPMIPFLLQDAYGGAGMMQEDGIHATAKGNQVVAVNVLKLVKPVLKK